jgi:hypothetical protein
MESEHPKGRPETRPRSSTFLPAAGWYSAPMPLRVAPASTPDEIASTRELLREYIHPINRHS